MAQKRKESAIIYRQSELATGIYDMWLETDLALQARPGQFLGIYSHNGAMLLPRPISICEVDAVHARIRIVYRIAGKGTEEFAAYQAGEKLDILGVLGNGFPVEEAIGKRILLMGGGIGIPPMLELAKALQHEKLQIILGYRDQELFLSEELSSFGQVVIATEDGSAGTTGNVMDAIKEHALQADIIFACGPMPMLRAIKQYSEQSKIKAYISLEERMACGVGACLGCVCRTTKPDAHSHVHNARICTDGPVFEAGEVDI
ncbi:MAG: dihydroorotate dehydrogenase electron transfer subunit [Lachnospiraceae bacterium]